MNTTPTHTDTQPDFLSVTEVAGDEVSQEQVKRLCQRYFWAGPYCRGKDVVEVACGTGPGLGYLVGLAKSLVAGDISAPLLERTRSHYGDRIDLRQFDAARMPFEDRSKDVILIFEALYYLPDPHGFFRECARVLREGGVLLIATANKDLFDFNPSPYSHTYFGVQEFGDVLGEAGFEVACFGDTPLEAVSLKQRVLRPIKKLAVELNLIPKTAHGKKLFKRLVFGKLIPMPAEVADGMVEFTPPTPLAAGTPDRQHKVLFCAARKPVQH